MDYYLNGLAILVKSQCNYICEGAFIIFMQLGVYVCVCGGGGGILEKTNDINNQPMYSTHCSTV